MSWAAVFLALQAVWVVPTPPPATPTPRPVSRAPSAIVDRTVERPEGRTHLALFSNGVAVVAVRYGSGEPAVFRRTLKREDLVGYLVALEEVAHKIRELDSLPGEQGGREGTVTIRLAAGTGTPIHLKFSAVAMMPFAIGRLGTILDDLQAKVLATPPGYDEVMAWEPRRGDVVEMITGQRAEVVDVRDDGTVIVEYEDVGLSELVEKGERANRILHVLVRAER